MRRATSFLIWLAIIAVLVMISHWMSRRSPSDPISGYARVMDGNSLLINGMRIRLQGIDAPEYEQECKDAKGQTYACGRAAARALANAIARRSVTCEPMAVDRYDRDVALCKVNDMDLGETMVRSGNAVDYFSRGRYEAAEREARNARRGLWAGEFQTPSSWRTEHPSHRPPTHNGK